jgi:hypothetical protein
MCGRRPRYGEEYVMSLDHAQEFVKRLREDSQFRWDFGACSDQWERRRFVHRNGYRFSPAELVCAPSPPAKPTVARVAAIERARREIHAPSAFL